MKPELVKTLHPYKWEIYEYVQKGNTRRQAGRHFNKPSTYIDYSLKIVSDAIANPSEWWDGLGLRCINICKTQGINSRKELLDAYKSGKIQEALGYGHRAHVQFGRFLNVEPPTHHKVLGKTRLAFKRLEVEKSTQGANLLGQEVARYMQAVQATLESKGLPPLDSPKWHMVDDYWHYMTFAKEALSMVECGDFEDLAEMIEAWSPKMLEAVEKAVATSKIPKDNKVE